MVIRFEATDAVFDDAMTTGGYGSGEFSLPGGKIESWGMEVAVGKWCAGDRVRVDRRRFRRIGDRRRRKRRVVVEGNVAMKWIGLAAYVSRYLFTEDTA